MDLLNCALSAEDIVQNGISGLTDSAGSFYEHYIDAVSRCNLEFDSALRLTELSGNADGAQLRHNAG